ncbi:MAG TPA: PTS sugar transporter subunit IIA [Pelolinea sp.]|nr:PTS sugar transporter subunit IIA [Pelolinea sp.]
MDENFIRLFNKEMIRVSAKAANTKEAIQLLGKTMAEQGYVEELYWQDVLKREETFPTGLPTEPVAIAIPHADPDRVIKSGIAIAVFKQPVKFRVMGSNDPDTLDVPVVFMLALKDFKQQTAVIRDLLMLIQSKGTIQAIYEANSVEEIYQIITISPD